MKFRSWNEKLKCFIYFEDGKYFIEEFESCKVKDNLLDLFNWQNKEQQVTINPLMYYQNIDKHEEEFKDVEFFEGDIIKMHFFYDDADPVSLGWIEGEKEVIGVLKCENLGGAVIVSDDKEYSYSLLQEPLEELERLGNIHENKEA